MLSEGKCATFFIIKTSTFAYLMAKITEALHITLQVTTCYLLLPLVVRLILQWKMNVGLFISFLMNKIITVSLLPQ